ncbi:hypothetical protein ACQP2F_45095 [Actinoplanes sp. CA-030573]|uniref:hypothetical protein n=1 Tax=Actinoplanes sp. CA-030573 TaxID=3239898 RepID=UPI003D923A34
MKPPICANCGDPAQWWDGNCRADLCGTCVPVRDEYVTALHLIRTLAARRRVRPGRPSIPNRKAHR